jgi:hypothetical protein
VASKIRFRPKAKILLTVCFFLSGLAMNAFAQETETATAEAAKWKKKPAFALKIGSFFPTIETIIRTDSTGEAQGTPIDLEDDLGLNRNPVMIRFDGDIRIASWFSVDLAYYGFRRSKSDVINKDITIGDTVFPVSQTLKTSLTTNYWNADFKFYLFNRSRWDFGVYAGLNLARYKLHVQAEEIDRQLLEIKKVWAPVPSLGVHFSYTILPKLYLYGKAGYFKFSPKKRLDFDSSTITINLDYYFYKFLGIGARYEYSHFNLSLDVKEFKGQVKYDLSGVNVYLALGF